MCAWFFFFMKRDKIGPSQLNLCHVFYMSFKNVRRRYYFWYLNYKLKKYRIIAAL